MTARKTIASFPADRPRTIGQGWRLSIGEQWLRASSSPSATYQNVIEFAGIDRNLSDPLRQGRILRAMNTAAAPPNDPTAALWAVLRDFIVQAFSLFGAPHELAQQGARLRTSHKLLID